VLLLNQKNVKILRVMVIFLVFGLNECKNDAQDKVALSNDITEAFYIETKYRCTNDEMVTFVLLTNMNWKTTLKVITNNQ